eukprot:g5193.t1
MDTRNSGGGVFIVPPMGPGPLVVRCPSLRHLDNGNYIYPPGMQPPPRATHIPPFAGTPLDGSGGKKEIAARSKRTSAAAPTISSGQAGIASPGPPLTYASVLQKGKPPAELKKEPPVEVGRTNGPTEAEKAGAGTADGDGEGDSCSKVGTSKAAEVRTLTLVDAFPAGGSTAAESNVTLEDQENGGDDEGMETDDNKKNCEEGGEMKRDAEEGGQRKASDLLPTSRGSPPVGPMQRYNNYESPAPCHTKFVQPDTPLTDSKAELTEEEKAAAEAAGRKLSALVAGVGDEIAKAAAAKTMAAAKMKGLGKHGGGNMIGDRTKSSLPNPSPHQREGPGSCASNGAGRRGSIEKYPLPHPDQVTREVTRTGRVLGGRVKHLGPTLEELGQQPQDQHPRVDGGAGGAGIPRGRGGRITHADLRSYPSAQMAAGASLSPLLEVPSERDPNHGELQDSIKAQDHLRGPGRQQHQQLPGAGADVEHRMNLPPRPSSGYGSSEEAVLDVEDDEEGDTTENVDPWADLLEPASLSKMTVSSIKKMKKVVAARSTSKGSNSSGSVAASLHHAHLTKDDINVRGHKRTIHNTMLSRANILQPATGGLTPAPLPPATASAGRTCSAGATSTTTPPLLNAGCATLNHPNLNLNIPRSAPVVPTAVYDSIRASVSGNTNVASGVAPATGAGTTVAASSAEAGEVDPFFQQDGGAASGTGHGASLQATARAGGASGAPPPNLITAGPAPQLFRRRIPQRTVAANTAVHDCEDSSTT